MAGHLSPPPEFLIPWAWSGAGKFAFLIHSLGRIMLLVWRIHLVPESQEHRKLPEECSRNVGIQQNKNTENTGVGPVAGWLSSCALLQWPRVHSF